MSKKAADLPVAQLMRQIQENAPKINELASQLTSQIQAFENWFNELPGRVETFWTGERDSEGWLLHLRFHRSGKRWIISITHEHPDYPFDEDIEWKPLTDASIEIKLEAIESFPSLLSEMLVAQNRLKDRLTKGHTKVGTLTHALEQAKKEGA